MSKNKLKVEFSYDFILFGIISTLKEYKLAWEINKALDISLAKETDIEIEFFNKNDLVISNYIFETENSEFRLLKNKALSAASNTSQFLLPELHSFDYIILVNGFEDTYSKIKLKEKLQSIPGIQYLKIFNPDELKSKENLIF